MVRTWSEMGLAAVCCGGEVFFCHPGLPSPTFWVKKIKVSGRESIKTFSGMSLVQ